MKAIINGVEHLLSNYEVVNEGTDEYPSLVIESVTDESGRVYDASQYTIQIINL